jgi:hypothetical protein
MADNNGLAFMVRASLLRTGILDSWQFAHCTQEEDYTVCIHRISGQSNICLVSRPDSGRSVCVNTVLLVVSVASAGGAVSCWLLVNAANVPF